MSIIINIVAVDINIAKDFYDHICKHESIHKDDNHIIIATKNGNIEAILNLMVYSYYEYYEYDKHPKDTTYTLFICNHIPGLCDISRIWGSMVVDKYHLSIVMIGTVKDHCEIESVIYENISIDPDDTILEKIISLSPLYSSTSTICALIPYKETVDTYLFEAIRYLKTNKVSESEKKNVRKMISELSSLIE